MDIEPGREVDEAKARVDAQRGAQARGLLENPLLKEAFATLEAAYIGAWRNTTIDNVAGREKVFLAINIVGKVQEHLLKVLDDGALAVSDLRRLAEAAERKKTWAEVNHR